VAFEKYLYARQLRPSRASGSAGEQNFAPVRLPEALRRVFAERLHGLSPQTISRAPLGNVGMCVKYQCARRRPTYLREHSRLQATSSSGREIACHRVRSTQSMNMTRRSSGQRLERLHREYQEAVCWDANPPGRMIVLRAAHPSQAPTTMHEEAFDRHTQLDQTRPL